MLVRDWTRMFLSSVWLESRAMPSCDGWVVADDAARQVHCQAAVERAVVVEHVPVDHVGGRRYVVSGELPHLAAVWPYSRRG